MEYARLAEAYERLEATSKRLELRAILVELFRPVPPSELPTVLYLAQGSLRPEYEGVELGVATSLAGRAVALATGKSERDVAQLARASGDLGKTAEALLTRQRKIVAGAALEVAEVYRRLQEIARASGTGSQETKVGSLVALLERAQPIEAKHIVRFVLGTLRVGVREMTILDALAVLFADGSKAARTRIESAFNVTSDLGLVAATLQRGGLAALDEIRLTVGRPIRPMLAERSTSLEDIFLRLEGKAALEYKYDGLRLQAHIDRDGAVRLFSRRLEEVSAQFPDVALVLPKAVKLTPVILEGECVPVDPDTDEIRPFQEISRRRGRKYDLERMQTEVPVCLYLFDVLLAGKEELLDTPFPDRRRRLERLLRPTERVRLAHQKVVTDVEGSVAFLDEAIAAGCEGLMAKSVAEGSVYRAGARGYWWIKYKRDYTKGLTDSIDGVVVGGFSGRGRRAGQYGALLLAVYDAERDRFESFTKVGTGFDDALLAELPKRLRPYESETRPESVETGLAPDQWLRPGLVLEVRGAELSLSPNHRAAADRIRPGAGLALRFPRFTGRVREDKGPSEATTSAELVKMYRAQVRQAPRETSSA